jgi:hypothetical protein
MTTTPYFEIVTDDILEYDVQTSVQLTRPTVVTPVAKMYAGINIFVTVVFILCGVFLLAMIALLFISKKCKIFLKGDQNPRVGLLESFSDEDVENNIPLTPRKVSRTTSDRGPEIKIEEEFEMFKIRQTGKKDNTAPVLKFEDESKSYSNAYPPAYNLSPSYFSNNYFQSKLKKQTISKRIWVMFLFNFYYFQ